MKDGGLTDKLHGEAEDSTEIGDEEEFEEVVDSRVDPSTTLTEKHPECVGDDGLADGLRTEDHFAARERPQHERREVSILSEEEQVLLVQRVDDVLRVVLDDVGIGEDGDPVPVVSLGRLETVHGEASREAGDAPEDGLGSLDELLSGVVLEDYGHDVVSILLDEGRCEGNSP
jgi:hypothetical protein